MRPSAGLVLVVALMAGCGGSGSEPSGLDALLLAPESVGEGYEASGDECAPLARAGASPAVADLVGRVGADGPLTCVRRLARGSDGSLIQVVAIDFPDEDTASRAIAVAPELIEHVTGSDLALIRTGESPGDEASVSGGFEPSGDGGDDAVAVAWRDGRAVGAVLVSGLGAEHDEIEALRLAAIQHDLVG